MENSIALTGRLGVASQTSAPVSVAPSVIEEATVNPAGGVAVAATISQPALAFAVPSLRVARTTNECPPVARSL